MDRVGRNPGLTAGFTIAIFGALVGALGIQLRLAPVLLLGLFGVGFGQGATNLARYAAADLAKPDQRSRAISFVVFASTIGAVSGSLFSSRASSAASNLGIEQYVGPMVLGSLFFAAAALVVRIGLRPDPLLVAHSQSLVAKPERLSFGPAISIVWASAGARLGLLALSVSTAVMVSVMAMTPLHMDAHGHSDGNIGWVISAHTAGMFAFAPLAGWYSDNKGRLPAVFLGAGILVAATIVAALAVDAPNILMFPSLYLLGLGWSFGIVAGSALITESVEPEQRVSAQGAADVAAAFASGVGALSAGFVFSMAGFHILSMMGTAAAAALLLIAFVRQRTDQLSLGV